METLAEKTLRLRSDGLAAIRVADFWQGQITKHGEFKAQEFYLSLGRNHIERKGYDWDGLQLSREPKEHEKIAVKGVSQAQESSKEQIGKILLSLREELISDGLKGIGKLEPATYHTLVLNTSPELRESLRDRLIKVYREGRLLVATELSRKEAVPKPDEFDDLDDLVDLTDSRIANEVQVRIIAAAARYRLLGLGSAALWKAVEDEIRAGSVSYIDRASTGLANKVISIGRSDEAQSRNDEWQRVEYSALLDQNVCGPCAAEDGKEANSEGGLTPTPNPECEGGDWCRCFHVFVAEGNM